MPLGLSKKFGSFRGKKPSEQEAGGSSLSSVDPDLLHSMPIGAELKVDASGNVITTEPRDQPETQNKNTQDTQTDSASGSERDEAHSFDSIDTISEPSIHFEDRDVEVEKKQRMRKLLKYSQWIKKRTEGEQKQESKSVLALQRKMARQEEKLDKLCLRRDD